MQLLPVNYDMLSTDQQRNAVATALNMSWSQFTSLPPQKRVELFTSIQRPEWEAKLQAESVDIVGYWSGVAGNVSEKIDAARKPAAVVLIGVAVLAGLVGVGYFVRSFK